MFREALKAIGKVLTVPLPKKKTEQGLEFGNIEFKDVNFAYGKDGFELKNINLTFKKNSVNAFVGASGCGKSTVSNLLMGFWDADEGQILINGTADSRCRCPYRSPGPSSFPDNSDHNGSS